MKGKHVLRTLGLAGTVAVLGLCLLGGLLLGVIIAGTPALETFTRDVEFIRSGGENFVAQPGTAVPDPTSPPVIIDEVPPQPVTAVPPTPTAEFAATPEFAPQFLADCALAQSTGRRSSPRCPTNAAEMLGTGR